MRVLVVLGVIAAAIAARRRTPRQADDLWQRAAAEADRVRDSPAGP